MPQDVTRREHDPAAGGSDTRSHAGPLPLEEAAGVTVDIVVPAHNEEAGLDHNIRRLAAYLAESVPFPARITIADNASTDATWPLAQQLAAELPGVRAVHLERKGRGHALHHVWSTSDAPVLAYMDVDLSTDLAAFGPLIAPLVSGHGDVAIGTRFAADASVVRSRKRELLSRGYNLFLRGVLGTRFSDAQCGFKAVRADAGALLLPHVHDTAWFFDTELLVLAERAGLGIHEVPVTWVEDNDSSVDVVTTAVADVRGVCRVAAGLVSGRTPVREIRQALGERRARPTRDTALLVQLVRFALVGAASTLLHATLFLLLRDLLGPQGANASALFLAAVANTAANRRWTFAVTGRDDLARHYTQALAVFGLALALTSGALALLHALTPTPARVVEVVVLVAAALSATLLRFLLLRRWVFRVSGSS